MKIKLSALGEQSQPGSVDVKEDVFNYDFKQALVHQVVTAYLAGARAGTHQQKTRADVRGGGRKPWRQKGTGNARAGTRSSPLWRSGGVTFAARPRNYSQKVNRQMYRGALRSILSELVRQDRLLAVENISLKAPKTKMLADLLKPLKLANVLIVTDKLDVNLHLAARNLPRVQAVEATKVNPVDLVNFDQVLISVPALKQLEERLV